MPGASHAACAPRKEGKGPRRQRGLVCVPMKDIFRAAFSFEFSCRNELQCWPRKLKHSASKSINTQRIPWSQHQNE